VTDNFVLGLRHTIEDSPFLTTPEAYHAVGQNSGNLAFHFAIDRHLGGDRPNISWYVEPAAINAMRGTAVLPCANQLGPHANLGSLAQKFAKLTPKMVAIGLGAQASNDGKLPEVPEGSIEWVKQLAAHAPSDKPNITVRGPFTLKVLEHYGLGDKAIALGCPTLFINKEPALGRKIAERYGPIRRIAVAAGHQRWRTLARIEASLARMVTATHGGYISQSPLEMLQITRGEATKVEPEVLRACRDYACPEMSLEEFAAWADVHGRVFFSIPAWMEYLRGFDFVVGARIHGVILALQAGIPGLCIAHDARTLELCEMMKVPHVVAREVSGGLTREDLPRLFAQFDPVEFDRNRAMLAKRYAEFLRWNGLEPAPLVTGIADTAESAERSPA
jgi:hypothetical protein